MKKLIQILLLTAVTQLLVISCSSESSNDNVITEPHIVRIDENYEDIHDPIEIMSGLTADIIYPVSTLAGLKFVYPYVDPKGKPVTLSGIICIPKTLYNQSDKKAQGIMLYNHYTIMTDDECPSYGVVSGKGARGLREISALELKAKLKMGTFDIDGTIGLENHKIITVAADYYGFGETKDCVQYYCGGDYNARASLEALKAAKTLLTQMGYSWDDYLLNTGYSQGGQTAIAVQKLVDSGEYDEKITATFAGSGPYDLAATYNSYIDTKDQVLDLSVVVYPVLSFNVHKSLGLSYSEVFHPTLAENVDNWFLSKELGRGGIDSKLKENNISKLALAFKEPLLDKTSATSLKLSNALDSVTLTSAWTPNPKDRIYLCYSEADTLVPPVNCEELITFFKNKSFTIDEKEITDPGDDLPMLVAQLIDRDDIDIRPKPGTVKVRKIKKEADVSHEPAGIYWILDILFEIKLQFSQ